MKKYNHNYINDINIKINSYDLMYKQKDWKTIKYHNEYAIWYLLSGSINILIENENYTLKEGDVFFSYPNKVFTCTSGDEGFSLRSIHFNVYFENSIHLLEVFNISGVFPNKVLDKDDILFKEIFRNRFNDNNVSKVALKGYVLVILSKIFDHYFDSIGENEFLLNFSEYNYNKFQVLFEYIYKNISKKITVQELALQVNLSTNYFSAFFKKISGMSVQNFILRIKMIKAKELIKINKYPIKEVSYLLGYNDQNAFSKAFKRYHKVRRQELLKLNFLA